MLHPPRLVASDLDGTLLGQDGTPSDRTRAAVLAAANAGAVVVLATGRPAATVVGKFEPIEGVRYLVADNGAQVLDLSTGETLHQLSFGYHLARSTVQALRGGIDGLRFCKYTDAGGRHEPGFAELVPHGLDSIEIDDVLDLAGTITLRMSAFHLERRAPSYLEEVRRHLPAPLEPQLSGLDAVEIGVPGHDKATGLGVLCTRLGIDRADVVAFGDNVNDWTMLDWAGHSVAMGNADRATRARAREIAADHRHDGVARVLERLFVST